MKTIITLDRANQPYGYPQLDGSGSLHATGSLYGTASFAVSASWAPPSLLGGTQYSVPLWTGATTLGTSSLYESGSVLKSMYGGNDIGLKLDFANNFYWLGDHSATSIGNALLVSPFGIETQMTPVGNTQGFQFYNDPGMGIRWYKFGDIGNYDSGSSLEIDDWNGVTKTKYQGNDTGLYLDFSGSIYQFGQLAGVNSTRLIIDGSEKRAYFINQWAVKGLVLNFDTAQYSLGDFYNTSGSTKLVIDDNARTVSISGSTVITGSVNISSVLNLAPLDPLPAGTTGSLATSGSSLYFHDGSSWRQVTLV